MVDEYYAGIGATNNTNHSSRKYDFTNTKWGWKQHTHTHTRTKSAIYPPVNQHRCGKPAICRSFSPGKSMDYPPSFCMVSPGQWVDLREFWSSKRPLGFTINCWRLSVSSAMERWGRKTWRIEGAQMVLLPSGNLTVCYWKWPLILDFPIKNGDFP